MDIYSTLNNELEQLKNSKNALDATNKLFEILIILNRYYEARKIDRKEYAYYITACCLFSSNMIGEDVEKEISELFDFASDLELPHIEIREPQKNSRYDELYKMSIELCKERSPYPS